MTRSQTDTALIRKLTKALTQRETEFGRPLTPIEAAQGVVAALPEMAHIEDLVRALKYIKNSKDKDVCPSVFHQLAETVLTKAGQQQGK